MKLIGKKQRQTGKRKGKKRRAITKPNRKRGERQ
jgi:hypothetical protein